MPRGDTYDVLPLASTDAGRKWLGFRCNVVFGRVYKRSSIRSNLETTPLLERLPGDAKMVLFRVLQESLTNVHRHSQSRKVDVRIELENGQVTLVVRDYGRGFGSEQFEKLRVGADLGVGFAGMHERVSELGGTLDIISEKPGTFCPGDTASCESGGARSSTGNDTSVRARLRGLINAATLPPAQSACSRRTFPY